jgi:GntR family transcriptional regulator
VQPLYQRVAGDIRAKIEHGILKPGDKLPSTRQLVEQYEVSETVIRFAMVQLKAEGLVYGQPGKGVYVSQR